MDAGGSGGGDAGSTEPQPYEKPTVDISGRWGLFFFEDPVGVQLFQAGNQLSGTGCDVGAPPLNDPTTARLCGDIVGTVSANKAYFGFHFDSYDYIADVTVSLDGKTHDGALSWNVGVAE